MTHPQTPDRQHPFDPPRPQLVRIGRAVERALDDLFQSIGDIVDETGLSDSEAVAYIEDEYGSDLAEMYRCWGEEAEPVEPVDGGASR